MSRGLVHLVDDDAAVRTAIQGLLRANGYDTRHYAGGPEFLGVAETAPEGCVLLDLRMPDMSGLEVQARLLRLRSDLPVFFLTAHGDVPAAVTATRQGALDFLLKPVREADLLAALDTGFRQLASSAADRAAEQLVRQRMRLLTPREVEVIALVADGLLNRQIALQLRISVQTVKVHRMRAMAKLKVRNILQLTTLWRVARSGRPQPGEMSRPSTDGRQGGRGIEPAGNGLYAPPAVVSQGSWSASVRRGPTSHPGRPSS